MAHASICLTSISSAARQSFGAGVAGAALWEAPQADLALASDIPELQRIQSWLVGIVLVSGWGGASALEECGKSTHWRYLWLPAPRPAALAAVEYATTGLILWM